MVTSFAPTSTIAIRRASISSRVGGRRSGATGWSALLSFVNVRLHGFEDVGAPKIGAGGFEAGANRVARPVLGGQDDHVRRPDKIPIRPFGHRRPGGHAGRDVD